MYERLDRSAASALAYRITATLTPDEVRRLTDELEGAIAAAGEIRVLVDLQAFPYRDLGALWEDLKFDVRYGRKLERFALVGGGELAEWAVQIFGLLAGTACRCFAAGEVDRAWSWLTGRSAD